MDVRVSGVWVTGIGLTTGLGLDREASWQALRSGRSGIRFLDEPGSPAGAPALCYGRSNRPEPVLTLADRVATSAILDAGLSPETEERARSTDPDRVATLIGISKGGLKSLARVADITGDAAADMGVLGGLWQHRSWPHTAASRIAGRWKFRGPSLVPVAACATGLMAALQGADLIRRGICDLAVCGAADASLDPLVLGAFRNMRALAHVAPDPVHAIRPWDRRRSGFLIGEGAAILVLERADHARARGILPYAEFAGGAFGSDAYHMTDLNPDPSGLAYLIGLALKNSDTASSDLDHINVHGTATRQNDPLECRAIRVALGSRADSVSCSANKAQIGHLLGAAGAAELAITCLAIRDGFVPPTLNLDDPDPACDLDGTPHVGKSREIRAALKLSIGFGGHLAAAVLRRPNGPRRPPVSLTPLPLRS